jgi:glycosyltransferase involved in cell wall biosynthesis
MKTILSFIDWYLPGYRAGGTLKAFANQVAHLEGVYNFKIITRDTDYCETTPYSNVQSNAWNKIAPNADVYYISADQLSISNLKKIVNSINFDVVFIHGVYSFFFSILPVVMVRSKKVHTVLSAHGMIGKHSLSVKSTRKKAFLSFSKITGFYKNVVFHAANQAEAEDVKEVFGSKVKVIVAEELPMKMELDKWEQRNKDNGILKLCSVARISPEKNTLYALNCLKTIGHGNIDYDIYGPVYNQDYWNDCLKSIQEMPKNIKVNYKGSIPGEEVLPALKNYHAMFMPTTGENFGHTILESFMAATPVIISENTPWRGLQSKKVGWDLPLQKIDNFHEAIKLLLQMNQEEYNEWSQGALDFAKVFMQDNSIRDQNIKLFENEQ